MEFLSAITISSESEEEILARSEMYYDKKNTTVSPERKKIGREDFVVEKYLGKGGFAKVILVRKISGKDAGKYFAMKVMKKALVCNIINLVQAERNILAIVDHPFIVDLKYAFQTLGTLYFVLEYLSGGTLKSLLNRKEILSTEDTKFYLAEIILGLEYLHSQDIIHRDLKPENMLLDGQGHLKICDFGLSCIAQDTCITVCGTTLYMAPEIFKGSGYGKAVDWWSLGVILFEMTVGKLPFNGKTKASLIDHIRHGNVYVPKFVDTNIADIIKKLLRRKISIRLGYAEPIRRHIFFHNINWEHVYNKNRDFAITSEQDIEDDESECFLQDNFDECPISERANMAFQGFSLVNSYQMTGSEVVLTKTMMALI